MTPPAAAPDLTSRAAVLVNFDLATFAAGSDVAAVLAFLQERCQRTVTPSGQVIWNLTDRERRRCLAKVPLSDLRAARDGAATVPQIPVQAALDQSLAGGWTARELEDLTPEQARALSVVAAWWLLTKLRFTTNGASGVATLALPISLEAVLRRACASCSF